MQWDNEKYCRKQWYNSNFIQKAVLPQVTHDYTSGPQYSVDWMPASSTIRKENL